MSDSKLRKFTIRREVIEWLDVEAADEEDADTAGSETPIDEWTRDVKSVEIEPSS